MSSPQPLPRDGASHTVLLSVPPDGSAPVHVDVHPILGPASRTGSEKRLAYAGDITPHDAWALAREGAARIVDVRTAEERKFVGYIPDTLHVPWMTGTALVRNPRFARELETRVRKSDVLLFLCRSGSRSAAAATAARQAGFTNAFSVLEGFEGELDAEGHRGTTGGWRLRGLPWVQD